MAGWGVGEESFLVGVQKTGTLEELRHYTERATDEHKTDYLSRESPD